MLPSYDAEWDNTADAVRIIPALVANGVAFANLASTDATATNARDTLLAQYILPISPGVGFLTSQSIKGQILCLEGSTAHNLTSQLIVRVVDSLGTTTRATLLAADTSGGLTPEWFQTAPGRNMQFPRNLPAVLAANYTSVTGDHLVIAVGYRKNAAVSTTGTLRLGTNAVSDLLENLTSTADLNSWIEFSTNLTPATAGAAKTQVIVLG